MGFEVVNTEYGNFDIKLKSTKLKDVCLKSIGIQTGPFGSQLHKKDYVESGTPIITVEHLSDNFISHENTPFVSDEDKLRLKKYTLNEGDIVFSRVGSVDRRALVSKKEDGWLFSGRCLRIRVDKSKINPSYLSYFFGLESFKDYIRSIAVGATMPSINTKILSNLPIYYIEDLNIQKTIANIFSDIDNKIQLNNQINQTLEAMAQAIFKSWFVDFDPVRAKREVLDSGGSIDDAERAAMRIISSKTDQQLNDMVRSQPDEFAELQKTASLFPSQLVDSELGEIPEGWEVSRVENICWLNQNSVSKKDAPEKIEYVDLGNTKWGEIQATSIYDFENAPSRARRILKRNDTIIGTVRPRNGSYAYIYADGLTGSTGFAVLTPKNIIFSEFLYFCTTNEKNIERLGNLADGGAYPAVNSQLILNTPCVMPNCELEKNDVINSFHKITSFIMSKVYENYTQNKTLAELRDTLLPKLLSGELDVSELVEMQDD